MTYNQDGGVKKQFYICRLEIGWLAENLKGI